MQELKCSVQNYEWGKYDNDSLVGRLAFTENELFSSNNKVAYAEEEAVKLHEKDPKNYPDSNHKPELAIALSDFEILCGFQKPQDILSHQELLQLVPEKFLCELAALEEKPEDCKPVVKELFSGIWKSDTKLIAKIVGQIIARISKSSFFNTYFMQVSEKDPSQADNLMLRLNEQNPGGDVGILAPIFLNHFTLKPGEASFIGPNEPHAYLLGDCVECMACSDNTIRAGLTPKFKDIETLCENLTYRMSEPKLFESKNELPGILQYSPPVSEFAVQRINNEAKVLAKNNFSSIVIVLEGQANFKYSNDKTQLVSKPTIWFLAKTNEDIQIESPSTDFLAFRAFTPKN